MMGDAVHYVPPVFFNSSKFFEIEYTTVGDVVFAPQGSKALWRTHPQKKQVTQLIVFDPAKGDRVVGFNMLGSRWNHRILEQWILERRPLAYVREQLPSAQFDVEFGRIDLSKMHEMETTL